jgi:hypothetical protein
MRDLRQSIKLTSSFDLSLGLGAFQSTACGLCFMAIVYRSESSGRKGIANYLRPIPGKTDDIDLDYKENNLTYYSYGTLLIMMRSQTSES